MGGTTVYLYVRAYRCTRQEAERSQCWEDSDDPRAPPTLGLKVGEALPAVLAEVRFGSGSVHTDWYYTPYWAATYLASLCHDNLQAIIRVAAAIDRARLRCFELAE